MIVIIVATTKFIIAIIAKAHCVRYFRKSANCSIFSSHVCSIACLATFRPVKPLKQLEMIEN